MKSMDEILGVAEVNFIEEESEAEAEEEPFVEDVVSPRYLLLRALRVQDIRENFLNFLEASERRSKLLRSGQSVSPPVLQSGSLPELNSGFQLVRNGRRYEKANEIPIVKVTSPNAFQALHEEEGSHEEIVEENEREICRIFQKSSSGKKIPINGFSRLSPFGNEMGRFGLPPLNNSSSPYCNKSKPVFHSMNVPCFSSPISNNNVIRNQDETWLIP
ncbi:hypothetical protein G4B88_006122 [Cannabis sativa]|uniref:Uncharacterized protein n=1 Tax=Cannabis sativa TaxID=3483 RepID=A0A7J6IBU6_CANSA|nr:hypothetical protein G4B88_006122 [Cannabis sativa]